MLKRLLLVGLFLMGCAAPFALGADEHPVAHGTTDVPTVHQGDMEHGEKHHGLLPASSEEFHEAIWSSIWVIIIFLVMVAILYPTAWKNVLAGLKAREERIRRDIADAEAARSKAEATLREYNQQLAGAESRVRQMIENATQEGEKIAAGIRMRAQQEAEENKERAMREIEGARKAALSDIYAQAANLSTAIAEKILRRNINASDQQDLVQQSLNQLESAQR